jgi:hypothetical protein
VPTYNFALKVADFTDDQILNVLGHEGEGILGMPAEKFYEFHDDIPKVVDLCKQL